MTALGGEFKVIRLTFHFQFTAFFKNTRTLKLRSQLTFAFFAADNHLSGPLRKQKFTYVSFSLFSTLDPLN